MKALLIIAMSAVISATSALAAGEFRHVVFFKFKASATPEQVKEIEKSLAGGTRSAGHECTGRDSGSENPRSPTAWTERSEVKAGWIVLHSGPDARA